MRGRIEEYESWVIQHKPVGNHASSSPDSADMDRPLELSTTTILM
jgi:hypothetical protein